MEEKDIILSKWLRGESSDEEVRATLGDVDTEYLRSILQTQENVEITTADPLQQWERFEPKMDAKAKPKVSLKIWIVLVVSFLLGFILTYSLVTNWKEVVKPEPNEFMIYAFEDGSAAKLWPGSKIKYDKSSYVTNRVVKLEGQAFFDVKKGASFVVQTATGEVQVLGTSFDVWAIDKQAMDVRCHTGKVQVSDKDEHQVVLTAGERVMIEEKRIGAVETFDLANQQADSSFKYYDNAKVSWVINDLENLYGQDIDMDKKLSAERFTGVLTTNDLNRALVYFSETMQWSYAQKENKIRFTAQE